MFLTQWLQSLLSPSSRPARNRLRKRNFVTRAEQLERKILLTTFIVDSIADAGAGTFRQAIEDANANPGPDGIEFDLAGGGVQTIVLATALPDITGPVMIDATTDPDFAGTPIVELNGNGIAGNGLVLVAGADGSEVRGLIVNRFGGHGIVISANDVIIAGNFIGTDAAGLGDLGNAGDGIHISGASDNTIGGTTAADRNIISGNAGNGVFVSGEFNPAVGNTIQGNWIGLAADGSTPLGNSSHGITILDTSATLGGDAPGAGNVISGNLGDGIHISGSGLREGLVSWWRAEGDATDSIGSNDGTLLGGATFAAGRSGQAFRFDGADAAVEMAPGTLGGQHAALTMEAWISPATYGAASFGGFGRTVFGNTQGDGFALRVDHEFLQADLRLTGGNVLHTFTSQAIPLDVWSHIAITYDGATVSGYLNGQLLGTLAASGTVRNSLNADVSTMIGNDPDIHGGVQAGNLGFDGLIDEVGFSTRALGANEIAALFATGGQAKDGSTIQGNVIGLDAGGTVAVGNGGSGVEIFDSLLNTVGGATAAAGNVISGNLGNGIFLAGADSTANTILGNFIGTDGSGNLDRGNASHGVLIQDSAADNRIGTDADGSGDVAERNVISGNSGDGIRILGTGTDGNVIAGNYIGTNAAGSAALGNSGGGGGVYVVNGAADTLIGGTAPGAGNVISGNNGSSGEGVEIESAGGTRVFGNLIGLDATGTFDLGNRQAGVFLDRAFNTLVGGPTPAHRNIISGNDASYAGGVWMNLPQATDNRVQGNFIGTDATGTLAVPNTGPGVRLSGGAKGNLIGTDGDGTDDAGEQNVISSNGVAGVLVVGTGSTGNAIRGNAIFANAGLGIDLGGDGATSNDRALFFTAEPGALLFDGVDDFATVPDHPSFDAIEAGDRFTAEAWVNIQSWDGGWFSIFDKYDPAADFGWAMQVNQHTGLEFATRTQTVRSGFVPALNQWYHLAVSYDRAEGVIRFYVNGENVSESPSNFDVPSTSGLLYLGANPSGGDEYAHGFLDDLRIWNVSRSQADIQAGMNRELAGTEPGLAGYWQFNEGTGNVFFDRTGNHNDGTLAVGSTLPNRLVSGAGIGDLDGGPNGLQNFPVLAAALTVGPTATDVVGSFDSLPNATYALDFYASASADPSGHGEAGRFLGTTTVTTDGAGHASFSALVGASSLGEFITATATSADGTSEFAANVRVVRGPDASGNSLHFDGEDDFVEIANSPSLHSDRQLTVEGWFKIDDLDHSTWQNIFHKGNYPDGSESGFSNREYALWVNRAGFLHFSSTSADRVGIGELALNSPSGVVREGQWHHFAGVIDADAGAMRLYLDGELVASRSYSTAGIRETVGPLRFVFDGFQTKGQLDEMRIWNVARTQEQIQAHMHGQLTGTEAGLMGYWRFDEESGGLVTDLSGHGNHGRFTSPGYQQGIPGRYGDSTAYNFYKVASGQGAEVAINLPEINTTPGGYNTVSFWMDWNGANNGMPFGFTAYALWINGGAIGFNTGQGNIYGIDASGLANRWVHVTAAFANGDAKQSRLWIDGVEQTLSEQLAGQTTISRTATADARIAGWVSNGDNRYSGLLDEVAVFNRLLSDVEIQAQFASSSSAGYRAVLAGQSPTAHYGLDETSGETALDASGNGHSGTIVSPKPVTRGVPGAIAGDADTAAEFGESPDHAILLEPFAFPQTAFSAEIWLKTTATNEAGIVSYAVAGQSNEHLILNPRNLQIFLNGPSVTTGVSVNDGLWHHIVVTWQSVDGSLKLYKDGALAFSTVRQAGNPLTPGGALVLGQEQDSVGGGFQESQRYIGSLDEFAIYDGVLSASRVLAHYNAGTDGLARYADTVLGESPLVYWRLGETEGSLALDSSGNGNHGRLRDNAPTLVTSAAPLFTSPSGLDEITLTVTTTADSGPGSLRQAILDAHRIPRLNPVKIVFDIPATDPNRIDVDAGLPGGDIAPDIFVITPMSTLPVVTRGHVTIDGRTQGDTNPFGPEIVLDGSRTAGSGLAFYSSDNQVHALNIHSFLDNGISLNAGSGNWLAGNYLGTDPTGRTNLASSLPATAPVGTGAGAVFFERNGQVVVEAEQFQSRTGFNGENWLVVPNETSGVASFANPRGGYLQVVPDGGLTNSGSPPFGRGPSVRYTVHIDTPGDYQIFSRFEGFNGNSDSLYASIVELRDGVGSGQADWYRLNRGTDLNFDTPAWEGVGEFEGTSAAGNNVAAVWTITQAGDYTIEYIMREDGIALDAFVLQLTTRPTPQTLANGLDGVRIENGASGNLVGTNGDEIGDEAERNVISGNNRYGVYIVDPGTEHNVVAGNFIGTDAAGTEAVGNRLDGIRIDDRAAFNLIGTDSDGEGDEAERNVISGNLDRGILLNRVTDNKIAGNFIGTDFTGTAAVRNLDQGIHVTGASARNVIGTEGDDEGDAVEGNVISASGNIGIFITNASHETTVAGNLIGTDASGTTDLGNGGAAGIRILNGAHHNRIGSDFDGISDEQERNIISGNVRGVQIDGLGTTDNLIAGNFIGLDLDGQALGNDTQGVFILNGAQRNTIDRNVASGNTQQGVLIQGTPNGTFPVFQWTAGPGANGHSYVLAPSMQWLAAEELAVRMGGHLASVTSAEEQAFLESVLLPTTEAFWLGLSDHVEEGRLTWSSGEPLAYANWYPGQPDDWPFGSPNGEDYVQFNNASTGQWNDIGDAGRLRGIIELESAPDPALLDALTTTRENHITGNFIGTTADGEAALGNESNGVQIDSRAQANFVGTDGDGLSDDAEGNVISGNNNVGVQLSSEGTEWNVVAGNFVGTNQSGTRAIANDIHGIRVSAGASHNTIGTNGDGSNDALEGNLVSGNAIYGIEVTGAGTESNWVAGNRIGTDITGTQSLGNGSVGLTLEFGAQRNLVGTNSNGIGDGAERNIISGNLNAGVRLLHQGTSQNIIAGNFIGTDVTGMLDLGNASAGVHIELGASQNFIGTDGDGIGDAAERNVISGNQRGVRIIGLGTDENIVAGNFIGTNSLGTGAVGNVLEGLIIEGGARSNRIGTDGDGTSDVLERNLISGSGAEGVELRGQGTMHNVVAGNFIGTDDEGESALGNREGVRITAGASDNDIGGSTVAMRNLISGNRSHGVEIRDAATGQNVIAGNFIGTTATGAAALSNQGDGVRIDVGAGSNLIGTDADGMDDAAERNVISGNAGDGVTITGSGSDNVIAGNFIGTTATGLEALGNQGGGVRLAGGAASNRIGAAGNGLGHAAERNVISGNAGAGVEVSDSSAGTRIAGNTIGLGGDGNTVIGNGTGIWAYGGASDLTIGGAAAVERNVISGNLQDGIKLGDESLGQAADVVVAGNFIGTDVNGTLGRGNGNIGIHLADGDAVQIGTAAAGNVIAANIGSGIAILASSTGAVVQGNRIGTDRTGTAPLGNGHGIVVHQAALIGSDGDGTQDEEERNLIAHNAGTGVAIIEGQLAGGVNLSRNSIYSNGGLGIDFGNDGVTPNQGGVRNYPVLTTVVGGGDTRVVGTVQGPANAALVLDFFASPSADPSGFGEGRRYLASRSVQTNATGIAAFDFTLSGITTVRGEFLTATATAPGGSTSEFSLAVETSFNQPPTITGDNLIVTVAEDSAEGDTAAFGRVITSVPENHEFRLDGLFESTDPGDVHTVMVDWGDGTIETTAVAAGVRGFSLEHLYEDDTLTGTPADDFTIFVTVTDGEGASGSASIQLRVENVAPTLDGGLVLVPEAIDEGGMVDLSGLVVDPGLLDPHFVTVDWGDGSHDSQFLAAGLTGFAFSHAYQDDNFPAATPITVTLTDDDGGLMVVRKSLLVANVAPAASILGATFQVLEGESVSLTAGVSDPGSADTHSYQWAASTDGAVVATGTSKTFNFVPANSGDYVVTLTVSDDDGGVSGTEILNLAVQNVAPAIAPEDVTFRDDAGSTVTSVREGDLVRLNGSLADPGIEPHTVVIDWGDGSTPETMVLAAGVTVFAGAHIYADDPGDTTDDHFPVTVTVTDADLAQDAAAAAITIANVAPIPQIVDNGSDSTTVRLRANVTDAGTDNFTYAWTVTGVTLPPGTPTDQATISFDRPVSGVAGVRLTVTDDDAGATTTEVLFVAGTAAGDTISITPTTDGQDDPDALSITVTTDTTGTSAQDFDPVDAILISTGDGDDVLTVDDAVLTPLSVLAGTGNDSVTSGGGDDFLEGGAGDDTVLAGGGNDLITSVGNDDLAGQSGNDRYVIQGFSDKILRESGGDGVDTIDFAQVTQGVMLDLGITETAQPVTAANDTFTLTGDFENLIGTDFDDHFTGNGQDNLVFSGEGNDTIPGGGAGDDSLLGGGGNDMLAGADGNDLLDGGEGNDTINSANGNDTTVFLGDDTIFGGEGNDLIFDAGGNDSFTGGGGDDSIISGQGNDSYDGGQGNDTITSGGGNDTTFADGDDTIFGGDGNDLIFDGSGNDSYGGGGGDDSIVSGQGNDSYDGGHGNDTISSGGGNDSTFADGDDTIFGGDGNDLIFDGSGNDSYSGGGGDDSIVSGQGNDSYDGGQGNDTISSGGGNDSTFADGDDTIFGGDGNDLIFDGSGNDSYSGGGGDDSIVSGQGNDSYDGGQGNDTISSGGGNDSTFADGDDTIFGGDGNDLIFDGSGNDSYSGGGGDDSIVSGQGNDSYDGGAGNDTITFGGGNDSMFADGDDTIFGGDGNDLIFDGSGNDSYSGGGGDDSIVSGQGNDSYDGGAGNDTITFGGGNDSMFADGDDTIFGGDGNDLIFDGSGNDSYSGGGGDDSIVSGQGNDSYDGGAGNDTISSGGGNDSTFADGDDTIFGGDGNDLIFDGSGNDSYSGGGGDDSIVGGQGNDENDVYEGGDGNDSILGGQGNDTLDGGAGRDTLSAGDGEETVFGGEGNDLIFGGSRSGLIDAGLGDDAILSLSQAGSRTQILGNAGSDTILSGAGDETIVGGGGDGDWLIESSDSDMVLDDATLTARGVATYSEIERIQLIGGAGDNLLDASSSSRDVVLVGGQGHDTLLGGSGDDTLNGGAGDDVLDGGTGDDAYQFDDQSDGNDTVAETASAGADVLDFGNFTQSITLDLGITGTQAAAGSLSLAFTGTDSIEDVIGTAFSDQILGNSLDNKLFGGGGQDNLNGGAGNDLVQANITKQVYLDFDLHTGPGEHVYTTEERNAIEERLRADFADFDFEFTQTRPAGGPFVTVLFNATPLINGIPQPGGRASQLGWRIVELSGTVIVDVNGFLGAGNGLAPTSQNFVSLSSTIAAHELGHQFGLRHHDSFGDLGDGIAPKLNPQRFLPVYPGLRDADQTRFHLLASPGSVGTSLVDAAGNPFFGERERIKLAFAETGASVLETGPLPGSPQVLIAGVTHSAQDLGPLAMLSVPIQGQDRTVAALNVAGRIDLADDDVAESDFYAVSGEAGELLTVEVLSASLDRIGESIDSVLRIYDSSGKKLDYYGSNLGAFNDDNLELTDSILLDVVLPAAGTYFIEVDTFRFRSPEFATYMPDFDVEAFEDQFPLHPGVADNDVGDYELFLYRSSPDLASHAAPGDVLVGGAGADVLIGSSGRDEILDFNFLEDSLEDRGGAATFRTPGLSVSLDRTALNEGESVSLSGEFTTSEAPTVVIDWGDGTLQPLLESQIDLANGTFSASHVYEDDQPGPASDQFTIRVTLNDLTAEAAVTVRNLSPQKVDAGNFRIQRIQGQSVDFTAQYEDVAAETISIAWSLFDPSGQPLPSGTGPAFAFTPADNGRYVVELAVRDDDGGLGTDRVEVFVQNAAPRNLTAGNDLTVREGGLASLTADFEDALSDTQTFLWQVAASNGQIVADGHDQDFAFTPDEDGLYTVTVTVTDDEGASASDVVLVTAQNAAPAPAIATIGEVRIEGTEVRVTGTATDPGTRDSLTFAWAVLKEGASEAFATGADSATFRFTPDGDGNYRIVLTATDDDGGSATAEQVVTIANAVPLVTLPPDVAIDAGQLFEGAGFFTDPGADAWTATVDYGDGTGVQPLALNADKSFALSHAYRTSGDFLVTVAVADDDATATGTMTVTILNVAPVLTVAGPATGVRGQTRWLTLAVDDPADSSFDYEIDWDGDGTVDQTAFDAGANLELAHLYEFLGTYSVRAWVTDPFGVVSEIVVHDIEIRLIDVQEDPWDENALAIAVGGSIYDDKIDFLRSEADSIEAAIRTHTPDGLQVVTAIVQLGTEGFELSIDWGNNHITVLAIGSTAPIGRLMAFGQAGDDQIRVSTHVDVDSLLYGDAGRDILVGGDGDNVLFGGDGDDHLFGGDGLDILIGGDGSDRLLGQEQEDLLIGGYVTFAHLDRAIRSIAEVWTDRNVDYAGRVAALSDPGRIDGLIIDQSVFNDDDRDILHGGNALDWYLGDEEEDQFHATLDEIFTGIDGEILDI